MVFDGIGAEWLYEKIGGMTDHLESMTPVELNEKNRWLTVGSLRGPIDYNVTPYFIEILNCFDVNSPVREVNLLKGVQVGYSTLLESGSLYFIIHVPGTPIMYMTADNMLAADRMNDNFVPMLDQSGLRHLISPIAGGNKKTGETAMKLEFLGGGKLMTLGAKNADKMRNYAILLFLKDEIDAWGDTVGKDGDPDKLTDSRCDDYWESRKIFRGSTPKEMSTSKIYKQFRRGDERVYMFHCLGCGFHQPLVEFDHKIGRPDWAGKHKETGKRYGFTWELQDGILVKESVRYLCRNCGHEHFDYDKEKILSKDSGAAWKPTSVPVDAEIRSYYLPAFYSRKPWSARIADFLEAWDIETKKPKDFGKFQVFFNNVLAWPFDMKGDSIPMAAVSRHRRENIPRGLIPNVYAEKFAESKILFVTCTVDVQKWNLAVAVWGWTKGGRSFLIDYRRLRADKEKGEMPCTELDSHVWGELREIIEEAEFTSDDDIKYKIYLTLIDCGYGDSYDTVVNFCSDYEEGVIPIIGRDRPDKSTKMDSFSEFKTQLGTMGYKIVVDYYKDRLAPVLRRSWDPLSGKQGRYHFNAHANVSEKELKELTEETKKKKTDAKGVETWYWHRTGGRENELWDLLVYGHASVDMIAWDICIRQLGNEDVVFDDFWALMERKLTESQA